GRLELAHADGRRGAREGTHDAPGLGPAQREAPLLWPGVGLGAARGDEEAGLVQHQAHVAGLIDVARPLVLDRRSDAAREVGRRDEQRAGLLEEMPTDASIRSWTCRD